MCVTSKIQNTESELFFLPGSPKLIVKKYNALGKLFNGNRPKLVICATTNPKGTTINCRPSKNLFTPSGPWINY